MTHSLNFIGGSDKTQLTTINKIISYLLVGSLAAALIALGFKESIPDKMPDGAKLIVPLIFLAAAAFLGCVIEGLRAALARYVLRTILNLSDENKPHWIAAVLGLSRAFEDYQLCRKQFQTAFLRQKENYPEVATVLDKSLRSLARGLFFVKSNSDAVNQVSSHYATYILASGFLMIVITGPLWCIFLPLEISWYHPLFIMLFWLVAIYALASLSISMYLYSYEVIFRQAYITIKETKKTVNQEGATDM